MVRAATMPGKTVHKSTTPPNDHNSLLTQDVFLIHKGRVMKADAAVQAVKKHLKLARREAQDAGIVLKDLDENIAMQEQEPETVQETIRRKAQYAEWSSLAPGVQADLFKAPQQVDELKAAENEGYREGLEGVTAKGDRYDTSNKIGQARLKGWNKGQDVLKKHLEELSEARKAKAKDQKKPKKKPAAEESGEDDADAGELPPALDRRARTDA